MSDVRRSHHRAVIPNGALVLDIAAPHRDGEERLERALSVAAALADALARRDYIIDLFAAGPLLRTVGEFDLDLAEAEIPVDRQQQIAKRDALRGDPPYIQLRT